jgi:hypothetical protein
VIAATLAANGAAIVESASDAAASALTVSDVSLADFAAARACTVAADGVTAFVVGAAAEADGFLLGVGSGSTVGFGVAVSVGFGDAVSVGDAGVPVSSGVLVSGVVLPAVPVVLWALTTTPGATVLVVVFVVVVVLVALASVAVSASVVFGSGSGFGDAISGPAVRAVSVDCTVPAVELSDDGGSSAHATPCPVAIAVPTPSATASRPTRPT